MMYKERLLALASYQEKLLQLEELERDRCFCRHDQEHFQKVEEIGLWLKRHNGLTWSEEGISLAAYLHDLGRVDEYTGKASHESASAIYAKQMLREIHVPRRERERICHAVANHGSRHDIGELWEKKETYCSLQEILCFADQFSRPCYRCLQKAACKWKETEKMQRIKERFGEDVSWQQEI